MLTTAAHRTHPAVLLSDNVSAFLKTFATITKLLIL